MKVYDTNLSESVDVCDGGCLRRPCYWPRLDPGTFAQGRGYTNVGQRGYLCGNREIHGCPDPLPKPEAI